MLYLCDLKESFEQLSETRTRAGDVCNRNINYYLSSAEGADIHKRRLLALCSDDLKSRKFQRLISGALQR